MNQYPDTPQNRERIRRVAELIQGTCKSLDDVVREVFGDEDVTFTDLDLALLQELDEMVLQCPGCDWWCEASEMAPDEDTDEDRCSDCRT